MQGRAGTLEVGDRRLAIDRAVVWFSKGDLYIRCVGGSCSLFVVGAPFEDASEIADLPGRSWEPDDEQLSAEADVFAEGGLTIDDRYQVVHGVRISCGEFAEGEGIVHIEIELQVEDETWGGSHSVEGALQCRVVPSDPDDWR